MADEKGPTPPQQAQTPDKMLLIPVSLAQGILNYLAKQPCGDVYNFVGALMALKEAPTPAPAPPALVRKRATPVVDDEVEE